MATPQPTGPATPAVTTPSLNPPPIVMGSTGNALDPAYRLEPRPYKTATYQTNPADYTSKGYEGQGLVNNTGDIARGQYGDSEAYTELAKLGSPGERRAFLNHLYSMGQYSGNQKPGATGFEPQDINAMQNLFLYANYKGRTVDVAAQLLAAEPGITKSSGVPSSYRPTANQDIKAMFNQAAGNVLGRQLSDAELQKFTQAYHSQEMAQAGGGAQAPSLQVAATEAARAAHPAEAQAMGASTLMDIFDKTIKGLG